MKPITTAGLAESLEQALKLSNDATDALSQDGFSAVYENEPSWAIGPFTKDDSLTFTRDCEWPDPTSVGWTAASIFNPSVISHNGDLVLFYRASPRKESTASRIGIAVHDRYAGWSDSPDNPVIYPTLDNELLGCEDPKIYRADGRYFLFYNGVFPIQAEDARKYPSAGYPLEATGCDINLAISDDLVNWTKVGPVVPHQVSRLWAKGAVIPRNPAGEAVKIGGQYLMYLSEGCNGTHQVGRSKDMINWIFEDQPYLDLTPLDGHLHEVACAAAAYGDAGHIVIDFFYEDAEGNFAAAQALYSEDAPFQQIALNRGGTLSWGGLIQQDGTWLFAQGWDAPTGAQEIYFYRSGVTKPRPEKSAPKAELHS